MKFFGIGLIIFGVVALIYQGLTFVTPKDVVDLGFFTIRVYEHTTVPLPPIVGGLALAAGVVVLVMGSQRNVA
jgi:hypothetical protein